MLMFCIIKRLSEKFFFLSLYSLLFLISLNTPSVHAGSNIERDPYIAYQGLLQSLLNRNIQGIRFFLPAYQKLTNADPAFIRWADAIQAWHSGKYREAIKQYRWLIANYPDNEVIRLQLAIILFDNHDNETAEQQFQKLRSGKLTPPIAQMLDSYLAAIHQRDFWSFNTLLSYVNESNINNAPPPGTQLNGWRPVQPESATGFAYGLDAQKTWSFASGIFGEYRFSGYGNQFWNNRKYNELTLRNGAGLGYRNNDIKLLLLPFFEQRWYGGGSGSQGGLQRYSSIHGIQAESRYQLTANWLLYSNGEYGIIRHNERKYLNGNEYTVAATMVYFPAPDQFWFTRVGYGQKSSRDADDSYYRYTIQAGWTYEWPYGISSRLQVGYGKKQYCGKDIFGIQQKNHEYNGMITLWHRGVYFWAVTPKISWAYQKNASNHPFYNFDKHRVFLNLTREF